MNKVFSFLFIFIITCRSFCVYWTYSTPKFTLAVFHVLHWTVQFKPLLFSLSSLRLSLGSCSNLLLWLREKLPFLEIRFYLYIIYSLIKFFIIEILC